MADLDFRVLGLDVDGEEARKVANQMYGLLAEMGHDVDGVAPVLREEQ